MKSIANVIKVLHITFDMTIGGAQQVIRQLIENIDSRIINSEIACLDNQVGELGEILSKQGISIHLFNRKPGIDLILINQLRQLVRINHYNIIHCHQYTPYVYGLLASRFLSTKLIFTEHGRFYPDYGSWKRKLVNPIFSIFTDHITSISKATKEAMVKYENFKPSDIQVIYNGVVDCSYINVDCHLLKCEFDIPEDAFIFGTISRLQPIKNQKMMIRAFKMVNDKYNNTCLLIVGDGEIKNELMILTEELSISNNVIFTGFQQDPYPFHQIIDVFLLSSFSEGTSMTLLESMSFSKPSVATNVGGNPELISDGYNGFLIESDKVEPFAEACIRLYEDSTLKHIMGNNARELYDNSFRIDRMLDGFYHIYGVK